MKNIKGTPSEFAQQLLNPLTKYDFLAAYGQGISEEQNILGRIFAIEAANYSLSQLDGSIVGLVMTTQKLMEVLSLLTDEHFNLSFDQYVDKVIQGFDPSLDKNAGKNEINNIAFDAFMQVIKDVNRNRVKQFLHKQGYSFTA